MKKRFGWWLLAAALVGSQAGHLIAYRLRFGDAAMQVQSTGAHVYFLSSAKTGLGIAALVVLGLLLVVGAGRVASGRRPQADVAAPLVGTLAAVYTVQLTAYAVQETVEAMLGGGHFGSVAELLLWGALGQLPVAVAVTLIVRWLGRRVGPALAAITLPALPIVHEFALALSAPELRRSSITVATGDVLSAGFSRRGPPPSF